MSLYTHQSLIKTQREAEDYSPSPKKQTHTQCLANCQNQSHPTPPLYDILGSLRMISKAGRTNLNNITQHSNKNTRRRNTLRTQPPKLTCPTQKHRRKAST